MNLFRLAWRESRTARRRLLLYMSSISLGVAALVAIDSFAANTTTSIREQSRSILGGDVAFTSRERFNDTVVALFDSLRSSGVSIERVTSFASMSTVTRSGATRLTQVRAVSAAYPIYGAILTKPADLWHTLANTRIALVDPALLIALNARVGDTITLGFTQFAIVGTVESSAGDPGVAAIVGPRVFISEKWLEATRLLTFGSRAEYEAVARVPDGTSPGRWITPLRRPFERHRVRLRTVGETENNLTDAIAQLSQFLGVVGLVALLLGGIGVASGVHAFVQRKTDTIAILRCLGATGWQVLGVYVSQAAAMGFVGAAVGAVLGVAIQLTLPALVGDFLPVSVETRLEPRAVLIGLAIGVWVALIFSLRPLLAVRRVSPLVTLRRDAETLGTARRRDMLSWVVTAALALSVIALTYARADGDREGFVFTVAISVSLATLAASAWALTALARRAARFRWPYVIRQGVANLHRPANQTQSVVIALGFGAFLVAMLYLVQSNLLTQFDVSMDASRGNVLFFDVQDDQTAGVDSLIRQTGHEVLESVPIVTMRIAEIKGVPTSEYARTIGLPPQYWALRREYRSTYRDTIVQTEKILSGAWFGRNAALDSGAHQLSIERDIAAELQLGLGDEITWDVQGIPVRTRITSIREVNWGRFELNFFAVFPPTALLGSPQQHVIVAHAAPDTAVALLQRAAVARYPNVSSLDVSMLRATIVGIINRAAGAVRFLALFSFAMGIPVLISAVAATRRERLRESVLLKTLGATRRQIGRVLLSEYAALGLLGAATGALLAIAGAFALMRWVFEMPFDIAIGATILIAFVMMSMAVAIGFLTGREVFAATAIDALRE
ncbi:MAG TPA: FtsX-like permease family protein [Gemmatimonadaceae bacterium]|nr:FtsX-like permease family protein [Gemmatimonadaceae bacterium]